MNFLFIHQNFPGQFRHVAAALARDPSHQMVGLGDGANIRVPPQPVERLRVVGYRHEEKPNPATHHYLRDHEHHIRRGQNVARACLELVRQGFHPDVVMAHPGWGEAIFLRDVFPQARLLNYCEYYYRADGGDVGFDPDFPVDMDDRLKVRVRNNTQLQSLVAGDRGLSPTRWQHSRYPSDLARRIEVIHEGIDTATVRPDDQAQLVVDGIALRAGDPVITYVARNLEPYRGFHVFMRALPRLLARHPGARVLVVGGDDVSYGRRLPKGETYREKYLAEANAMAEAIDWSRVHFFGKLPYADYLKVLQVSAAHVYLTYPFVLSWSMLEAMATGCLLVASDTAPVTEVLKHGENGLLTPFFDHDALADRLLDVLAAPEDFRHLRDAARQTIEASYDRDRICLPAWLRWMQSGC